MITGIYAILNLVNDKVYIGSAFDVRFRWLRHQYDLKLNRHANLILQNAWNKYGTENFEFILIEFVDKSDLLIREQYWMDYYKSYDRDNGYNIYSTAGSPLGLKRSKKTKKLMVKSLINRWANWRKVHPEVVAVSKICRCGKEFLGLRCIIKVQKYCSEFCAHKYNVPWNKGKTLSKEIRNKFRIAKLKNPMQYWKGKKRSLTTRLKISKTLKNRSKKAK